MNRFERISHSELEMLTNELCFNITPTLHVPLDHRKLAEVHCSYDVSSFAGREGIPIHLRKVEMPDELRFDVQTNDKHSKKK